MDYKNKYIYTMILDGTGKAIGATPLPGQSFLAKRPRHIRSAIEAYNRDHPVSPIPTPLAISDFKNDTYSINGGSKTINEMYIQDASIGNFNPATDIYPNLGLVGYSVPVASVELINIIQPKFSFVIDCFMPDNTGELRLNFLNKASYFPDYFTMTAASNRAIVSRRSHTVSAIDPLIVGINKVAGTITDNFMAISVNGANSTIMTTNPLSTGSDAADTLYLVNSSGSNYLEKISFYSPQDATTLKLLST